MVRPALTKSCIPAPLSTVPQRTSQQSEKRRYWFRFSPKIRCLIYLTGPIFLMTGYCHPTLAWLRNTGSRICTNAKQGSPLSVVDITALSYLLPLRPIRIRLLIADQRCLSDASKPLLIQCEHYTLQAVLIHTLFNSPKHSVYLLHTIHYIQFT